LRASAGDRLYWRATLKSAPLLELVLLGQWNEQIRLFRWKWLAETAAWRHRRCRMSGLVTEAVVEAYRPGANIIPWRRREQF
jgi:hypothetical protein